MTSYNIEFTVTLEGFDRDGMEALFDNLSDAAADTVEDDHGFIDADTGISIGDRTLDLTITVEDDDDVRAVNRGMTAARTIVHTAGGYTPDWDNFTVQRELSPC